jgi:anaerobic dimethyl sulfoxide reductase subunit B (iron-sulfur subunit)
MEKTLYLDVERCVGCGACAVACMDQNDICPEKGQLSFRSIYQVEEGKYPAASIHYIATACLHCEDSPCLIACPTGAITKDKKTRAVITNRDLCIGCHSCALACPFGVPRYDAEDKMQKCDLCTVRVESGLLPACVKVCPQGALKFEPINQIQADKEFKLAVSTVKNLRSDKSLG